MSSNTKFLAVLVIPGALLLGLVMLAPKSPKSAEEAAPPVEDRTVTLAEYNAVQTGSSYEQVRAIVGFEGEEQSRSEVLGTVTVMYAWKNPNFTNMTAMFQNGKLTGKGQLGLK